MTSSSDTFVFLRRSFPSANMLLVRGRRPVLLDSGFGGDFPETEHLLRDAGTEPKDITLIANSHYHCDHAGGNGPFQKRYGTSVAAHRWEADMVNRRHPEACSARWLGQPIEPYSVTRSLSDGDRIDAGGLLLEVIETPGHTLGHLSFYAPEDRMLFCGDALHPDDVAWVSPFREGVATVERAIESVERLMSLKVEWACSGHGPQMENFHVAARQAVTRYRSWLDDPEKPAWHACKRILAYALMIHDGMTEAGLREYLVAAPWFRDHALHVFGVSPEDFVTPLLQEMVRAHAADYSDDGRFVARAPFNPPPPGWMREPSRPEQWPPRRPA